MQSTSPHCNYIMNNSNSWRNMQVQPIAESSRQDFLREEPYHTAESTASKKLLQETFTPPDLNDSDYPPPRYSSESWEKTSFEDVDLKSGIELKHISPRPLSDTDNNTDQQYMMSGALTDPEHFDLDRPNVPLDHKDSEHPHNGPVDRYFGPRKQRWSRKIMWIGIGIGTFVLVQGFAFGGGFAYGNSHPPTSTTLPPMTEIHTVTITSMRRHPQLIIPVVTNFKTAETPYIFQTITAST
jgi:hypothetical protein